MGVDETLLESSGLMPPKSDVVVGKLNNAKVYCVNDQPLFFDPNGKVGGSCRRCTRCGRSRGDASRHRHLQRGLPKVLGGADLMLPGFITSDEDRWRWRDEPVGGDVVRGGRRLALRARGNPHAFAIGEMAVSKAEAEACGMKGRGLKVMHHYPDALWAIGATAPATRSPGARVPRRATVAVPGEAPRGRTRRQPATRRRRAWRRCVCRTTTTAASRRRRGAGGAEDDEKEVLKKKKPPRRTRRPPRASSLDVPAPGGMDAMFERCFASALTRGLKDGDLPMRCELFYVNLLLPPRPPDVTLD